MLPRQLKFFVAFISGYVLLFSFTVFGDASEVRPAAVLTGRATRLVRDCSRFNFSQLAPDEDGGKPWAVLRIIPDKCSYTEYTNWELSEDGRHPVEADKATLPRVLYGADVELLGVLTVKPTCIKRFEEVISNRPNGPDPGPSERLYSPFQNPDGGNILCCIQDGFPGIYRYRPAILLPRGWETQVLPGWDEYKRNTHLFSVKAAAANRQELLKVLNGDNPFLAIAACRTLVEAGFESDVINVITSTPDEVLQGVMTQTVLSIGPRERLAEKVSAIVRVVNDAKSFEAVRGVAAGVFATVIGLRMTQRWDEGGPLIDALTTKEDKDHSALGLSFITRIRATVGEQAKLKTTARSE